MVLPLGKLHLILLQDLEAQLTILVTPSIARQKGFEFRVEQI